MTATGYRKSVLYVQEDPRLERMRYELVPKKVKEDEFWRNYFYRVGLVKQSFELTHGLAEVGAPAAKTTIPMAASSVVEEQDQQQADHAPEEEFVSDSHRVSSQDMAEADEAMKKLGLAKVRVSSRSNPSWQHNGDYSAIRRVSVEW